MIKVLCFVCDTKVYKAAAQLLSTDRLTRERRDECAQTPHACHACAAKWAAAEYCPICASLWGKDDEGMLQCDGCDLWVHAACDGLESTAAFEEAGAEYKCPTCRGEKAGCGKMVEAARACTARRCFGCDVTETEIAALLTLSRDLIKPMKKRAKLEPRAACSSCAKRWEACEYCLVCLTLWKDGGEGDEEDMVQCGECELWVHAQCEGLDDAGCFDRHKYVCPSCGGREAGKGRIITQARKRAELSKDLPESRIELPSFAQRQSADSSTAPAATSHSLSQQTMLALLPPPVTAAPCPLESVLVPGADANRHSFMPPALGPSPQAEALPSCEAVVSACAPMIQPTEALPLVPTPALLPPPRRLHQTRIALRTPSTSTFTSPVVPSSLASAPCASLAAPDAQHLPTATTPNVSALVLHLSSSTSLPPAPMRPMQVPMASAMAQGAAWVVPPRVVLPISPADFIVPTVTGRAVYGTQATALPVMPMPPLFGARPPPVPALSCGAVCGTGSSLVALHEVHEGIAPTRAPAIEPVAFTPPVGHHQMDAWLHARRAVGSLPPDVGYSQATSRPATTPHVASYVNGCVTAGDALMRTVFPPAGPIQSVSRASPAQVSCHTPPPQRADEVPSSSSASLASARLARLLEQRKMYESRASRFTALDAANCEKKMRGFSETLKDVYGDLPFAKLDWSTSVLGTLVGLICAQTCRNSWSSVGYANLASTFPTATGEPDWETIRRRRPADIEPCIWHGPYFHRKADRIHGLLEQVYADSGSVTTSLESLYALPSEQIRQYLMNISGLSGKSVACLLLYRMGCVNFAVDANVLRVMTRLGWLKSLGIYAVEGLSVSERRAARRAGVALPLAPLKSIEHRINQKLLSERKCLAGQVAVVLKLAVGLDGNVAASLTCSPKLASKGKKRKLARAGIMPCGPFVRVCLQLAISANGAVGASLIPCASHLTTRVDRLPITAGGGTGTPALVPQGQVSGKRRRCGACAACNSKNCGECRYCLNMPVFGGNGTFRQPCERRRCLVMKKPEPRPAQASGSAAQSGPKETTSRSSGPERKEDADDDIEDLPKSLKRHSKRVQEFMQSVLPTETAPHSELARTMYLAHVYMITHGAVLCGETPQCSECPLRETCEYGSLLHAKTRVVMDESPQQETVACTSVACQSAAADSNAPQTPPPSVRRSFDHDAQRGAGAIVGASVLNDPTPSNDEARVALVAQQCGSGCSTPSSARADVVMRDQIDAGRWSEVVTAHHAPPSSLVGSRCVPMRIDVDENRVADATLDTPSSPADTATDITRMGDAKMDASSSPATRTVRLADATMDGPSLLAYAATDIVRVGDATMGAFPSPADAATDIAIEDSHVFNELSSQTTQTFDGGHSPARDVLMPTPMPASFLGRDMLNSPPQHAASATPPTRSALDVPTAAQKLRDQIRRAHERFSTSERIHLQQRPPSQPAAPQAADLAKSSHSATVQMAYARVVPDELCAPRHPGDVTPRLLLVKSTLGDYAKGRLLFSPWSAFKGVFPMQGTYFAQNEVFEDESAGEVQMPIVSLGAERRVYLGKSIEGVLRYRTATDLRALFRESYVCIRRFRTSDHRLLPLVLDPPRLIKHRAEPSELALQLGMARPLQLVHCADRDANSVTATPCTEDAASASGVAEASTGLPVGHAQVEGANADEPYHAGDARTTQSGLDGAVGQTDDSIALESGLRLFSLYIRAGGALCMRQIIWRKLMLVLHPDRGGSVQGVQHDQSLHGRGLPVSTCPPTARPPAQP